MAQNQAMLMQQLMAQSQQQSQQNKVEFKCGKMKKADGETRVTPDMRKGKLTVKADQDQLMHVIWTNREQGIEEDDMIIFPGDATFGYVDEARNNKTNNRVFALKFTSTPKKVHFFWMQEPASQAEKDKELAEKVNAMLNGETPAASGGVGQMDQAQLMAMLTQAQPGGGPESPAAPAAAPAAAGATDAPAASDSAAGAEAGAAPATGGDSEDAADGDKMKVDEEAKP